MGIIRAPVPAKLIVGMIARQQDLFSQALNRLTPEFGRPDLETEAVAFTHTKYYDNEMGTGLLRKWVSFEGLIAQDDLPRIKLMTNKLEEEFADNVEGKSKRCINLDPGYVTAAKLVLASAKDFAHRLYLGQSIYGEVTLHYDRQRGWQSHEWTYPDYRQADSLEFFKQVRQIYQASLD